MDALSSLRAAVNPALFQAGAAGGPAAPSAALALRPMGPTGIGQTGQGAPAAPVADATGGASFEGVLGRFVGDVNGKLQQAGDAVHSLMSGEQIPLHRVMIASEEASLSFQLMVEVRNKLLDAYQELMRMQV